MKIVLSLISIVVLSLFEFDALSSQMAGDCPLGLEQAYLYNADLAVTFTSIDGRKMDQTVKPSLELQFDSLRPTPNGKIAIELLDLQGKSLWKYESKIKDKIVILPTKNIFGDAASIT